jgi:lipopolysaccharide transport system ATP-binding protein
VGDAYFQQKCIKRIKDFKIKGGAIIFVSHDLNAIKILSDRALLLDHGQVVAAGEPDSVINTYNFLLARKSEGQELIVRAAADKGSSYGNFKVEITEVKLLNAGGQDSELFISGQQCIIQAFLRAQQEVPEITVGILIRDRFGQDIFGTNSYYLNMPLSLVSGKTYMVQYRIDELNIGSGTYTVTVAAHTQETHLDECYHWADRIRHFEIVGNQDFQFVGISRLKPVIEVHPVD